MSGRLTRLVSIVALLLALLPFAFLITLLLVPFWRWLEGNFGIEAIGHSGPSEWCYLLVYLLCAALTLTFCRGIATVAVLSVILVVLVALFPLPHGGSIGEALWYELTVHQAREPTGRPEQRQVTELPTETSRQNGGAERFAGPLPFQQDFVEGAWRYGSVLGRTAWLDDASGMIWGERQAVRLAGWSQTDLQAAMTWCRTVEPAGYWSLPTNAEFALAVKARMQEAINDIGGRWIAQSHLFEGGKPFPSLVGFGGNGGNDGPQAKRRVSVRCVGRSEAAPEQGYFRKDISNEEAMMLLNR